MQHSNFEKELNENTTDDTLKSGTTLLEVEKEKVKLLQELLKYSTQELEQASKILKVISKENNSTDEIEFIDISTLPSLEKSRPITIIFGINKTYLQECFNQEMDKKSKTQLSSTTEDSKNINSNLNYEKEKKETKSKLNTTKKRVPEKDTTFYDSQETLTNLASQINLEEKETPPKSDENLNIDTTINSPSISKSETKPTKGNLKLSLI